MCCIEYTAITWEVARGNYGGDYLSPANFLGGSTSCVAVLASGTDAHCAGAYQV